MFNFWDPGVSKLKNFISIAWQSKPDACLRVWIRCNVSSAGCFITLLATFFGKPSHKAYHVIPSNSSFK